MQTTTGSLSTVIRAKAARMAALFVLSVVVLVALLGAYVAGLCWIGVVGYEQWGAAGAAAAVFGALVSTAAIAAAAVAILVIVSNRRKAEASEAVAAGDDAGSNPALPDTPATEMPSLGDILRMALGGAVPSASVLTIASCIGAAIALLGPVRIIRIVLRTAPWLRLALSLHRNRATTSDTAAPVSR